MKLVITNLSHNQRLLIHDLYYLIIITEGPASSLFQKEYYELMKVALAPGGIVCAQGIYWNRILLDRTDGANNIDM